MKSIIHLSDLHLSDSERYGFHWSKAEKTAKLLIDDIKKISTENNFVVDTIFFTGDMTFSGTKAQFDLFDKHFLNPIIESLHVNKKNIYFTPGNHDIDRNKVEFLEQELRTNDKEAAISTCFDMINEEKTTWKRLDGYFEYDDEKSTDHDDIHAKGRLTTCYKVTNKLYIISLNSAWLAMDNDDKGSLRITQKQLDFISRAKIPSDAKIIILTHHPLDWLSQHDREIVSSFIEKKISMLFFGHMHEFKQKTESSFSENITLFLQAGTLDNRESISGYSLITLNNSNIISDGKIFYRKYNAENEIFEPWLARGDNGEFDFSTEKALTFDSSKFSNLSNEILEKNDKDLLINIGISQDKKKSLRNLFTEPNFLKMDSGTLPSVDINSTKDLINGVENFILFGNNSSGKTSILKYLFTKSLEKQVNKDFSEFSFYLDLNDIELKNTHSILNNLCSQYFSVDLTTSFEDKIKKMLSEGHCIIYIDNIDCFNKKEESILSSFLTNFKKCRFITTADHCNLQLILKLLTDDEKEIFNAVSLGPLRRCNVRDIVSKWHDISSQNATYREITRTINNSQLPHNYFVYSMLLAIYEVEHDIRGILSESDIIENFIEILLRKHFMDTPPNKPQFKELLHFLGYLGASMFNKQESFISNNNLHQIALTFNRETLHDYQIEDYINPLKQCGILKSELNNIVFSESCFLYYSIAYFMKHDEKLKTKVLFNDNYLNLDKIIEYYSSQNSSSLELLYILKDKVNTLKETISNDIKEEKGIIIENIKIEELNSISILDMVTTIDDFEKKIESLKADKEKNDERLDKISPLSSGGKKANISNGKIEESDDLIHNLISTLSLYARVFRSTELSMERENTLGIFNDLVQGYIYYLKATIAFLDESFILPVFIPIFEKKMSADNISEKKKIQILETFKLMLSIVKSTMPNNIQIIMSNELHSKKPRISNIINEAKNASSNPVEKAILSYTLMDFQEKNTITLANEISDIQNKVVQESLFFKLNHIVTNNYDLSESDEKQLKKIIRKIGIKRKLVKSDMMNEAIKSLGEI